MRSRSQRPEAPILATLRQGRELELPAPVKPPARQRAGSELRSARVTLPPPPRVLDPMRDRALVGALRRLGLV
jgi:hypothetical protein